MDRKVLEKMNYGVFVVGTQWQGKRVGCVVNSFAQVTSNLPQKFTVTLNRDNETCKALLESLKQKSPLEVNYKKILLGHVDLG